MKYFLPSMLAACLLCATLLTRVSSAQTVMDQSVDSALRVLDEIMAVPARQIPEFLLADARGVAIIPNVVKGGFVVGVRHGRGVVMVRDDVGNWHPPIFVTLTGGSVGWQAGIQATDVILVFRTRKSIEGLMSGKLTIGVDAAAAAGPVGRQAAAATDTRLAAEILSYSRSRGLFAGVSIDGSMMTLDYPAGSTYYHTPIVGPNGEAIRPLNTAPATAIRLMNRLSQYSGSPRTIPTEAAPGSTAIPGETPQAELTRRQLAADWQELSAVLDEGWRDYLMPPREVLEGQPVDVGTLREKLQHYKIVAADQQYVALWQSAKFASTYQRFHEYVALQTSPPATTLVLPPPPGPAP